MAFVDPLSSDDYEAVLAELGGPPRPPGLVRNSERTMARRPELLRAFAGLARAAFATGTVSPELKGLVAVVVSEAAGCRYCQAHRVTTAVASGVPEARLAALWSFESSDLFSEAERAALRFAQAAGVVPNAVSQQHVDDLRQHFDDGEIVELTGVVATMGFLNRWNDSLATHLEDEPLEAATRLLAGTGWSAGKHG